MKVSKTVSIDIDLLQRVIDENPNFSSAVTEALENWLNFKKETERGNSIHFSRTFNTKIPPNVIWQLLNFDGIVKWENLLTKAEYLSEQKTGLGTRCKLFAKLDDLNLSSIATITEYLENEKMVFRSEGDFRVFASATLNSRSASTDVSVIIVVGLSDEVASKERKDVVYKSLESAFSNFAKVASTLS